MESDKWAFHFKAGLKDCSTEFNVKSTQKLSFQDHCHSTNIFRREWNCLLTSDSNKENIAQQWFSTSGNHSFQCDICCAFFSAVSDSQSENRKNDFCDSHETKYEDCASRQIKFTNWRIHQAVGLWGVNESSKGKVFISSLVHFSSRLFSRNFVTQILLISRSAGWRRERENQHEGN